MDQLLCLTTSISVHGLQSLQFTHSRYQVFFWTLVFLGSLCLLGYNICNVIFFFLQTPVAVAVTTLSQVETFPSVTVCNNNPYKISVLNQWETLRNLRNVFQKLQGSSSVRSKRNVKETGSNIRSAVSKTFHELDKSYHNAQGANRLKRATGDCAINPYPSNESPFPITVYYDPTSTTITNYSCDASTATGGWQTIIFNPLLLGTVCPSVGVSWPFPRILCATINYQPTSWLEIADIDTNATVTKTVAAATAAECQPQCLLNESCYGFTFKNGMCYFNNESGPTGDGPCGLFYSPGTTYTTAFACDYFDVYPLANGLVSWPALLRCSYWIINVPAAPGSNVTFTCNAGYNLTGFSFSYCDESTRTWTNPKPTCDPLPTTTTSTSTTSTSTTSTTTTSTTTTSTTTTTTTPPYTNPFNITEYNETILRAFLDNENVNDFVQLAAVVQDFLPYLLGNLTESQLAFLSYTKKDMFISCVYNSKICNFDDLLLVVDRSLGNCYTFNHQLMTAYAASKPGYQAGLHLILNAMQAEYSDWLSLVGMRVIIHKSSDTVFPDSNGYDLPPGYDTSFSVRKETSVSVNRDSEPCYSSGNESKFFNYKTDYTIEGCLRSFIQSKVIETCGCAFYKYALPNGTVSYCGIEKKSCVDNYLKSADGQSLSKTAAILCKQECSFVQFRPSISMVMQREEAFQRCDPSDLDCDSQINIENTVLARIYFESLTSVNFLEFATYEVKNLLADTGSQMGIWLGMSVISAVEIIILCGKLIQFAFKRKQS